MFLCAEGIIHIESGLSFCRSLCKGRTLQCDTTIRLRCKSLQELRPLGSTKTPPFFFKESVLQQVYIILLHLEPICTLFFRGSAFSQQFMSGESSYMSFKTKIQKWGQLLSENSQDTHWIVIFLVSEEIHFTLYGPNPKFTEALGFSLTLTGFRSDNLKKK